MKIQVLLYLLIVATHISARDYDRASGWRLEGRSGVFIPTKSLVRSMYSNALPIAQVEAGYTFCNHWDVWTNVGWTGNKGRTPGFCYKTHVNLIPISAGINYDFNIYCHLDGYIGGGITGAAILFKDCDGFLQTKTHSGYVGGTSKAGLRYEFCKGFTLNLFVDYLGIKFSNLKTCDALQPHPKNFSGTNIGLGFGYQW